MEVVQTSVFMPVAAVSPPPIAPVTLMPRLAPIIGTTSRDEWQCYRENIDQYFQGPNPSGALDEALLDYADILNSDCTITMPETGTALPTCLFPGQEKWCGFTTFAPSLLLVGSAQLRGFFTLARYCPNRWKSVMAETPYGELWLNDTIAWAGCYGEAHPTGSLSSSFKPTATPTAALAKATNTPANNVAGRKQNLGMMAVAGVGVLAAVA